MASWQIVHIRVNDSATGRPAAVRIRFTDAQGAYLPPLGRRSDFPTGDNESVGGNVLIGGRAYAYIDGACEVRLPAGTIHVEIHKGPEYQPIRQTIERRFGQVTLRFTVERQSTVAASGWHAGDVQSHCLRPSAAALEGAAEGLDLVHLLIRDDGGHTAIPDPMFAEFSGQAVRASHEACQVCVNSFNRGAALGDLILLHCHRLVFPLRLQEPGFEHYTLLDWAGQCHRKGGLTICPDLLESPGEHLAAAILGGVDAVLWAADRPLDDARLSRWYQFLNSGFRLPLTGGSGKSSNRTPLGAVRTLARLPAGEALTLAAWIEAVRAGRCYATAGPLLDFTLNGRGPGEVLPHAILQEDRPLEAAVHFQHAGGRAEIVHNGVVIHEAEVNGGVSRWQITPWAARSEHGRTGRVGDIPTPAWFALRVKAGPQIISHTAPIYIEHSGPILRPLAESLEAQLAADATHCLANAGSDARRHALEQVFRQAHDRLHHSADNSHTSRNQHMPEA